MPEITSVEQQKNNPKRFNIFLDGEFAFGADEDLIVDKRLVTGKILTASDVKQLIQEAEIGKLMEKMYRLFSIRQRSEKEVRDYFRSKRQEAGIKGKEQISILVIDQVIETLKNKGLINDLEFAKSWIEARRRSRQKADRLIKLELLQKGIEKEIIEEAFSRQLSDISQADLASKALEKKMRIWKNLSKMEFKKKAYQYLNSKGFPFEIISVVIEKFDEKS